MAFDPNITYWQSLRIVARGLIQNPIREGEWEPFIEGVKDALYYGLSPVLRLLVMLLLPITAPLFALLVQMDRRKTAAKIAARQAEAREAANAVWGKAAPKTPDNKAGD